MRDRASETSCIPRALKLLAKSQFIATFGNEWRPFVMAFVAPLRVATIAHHSISSSSQRQALSVAVLGIAAVVLGTVLLLMFTGLIGTVAVASTLAFSARPRLYRLPDKRPIIVRPGRDLQRTGGPGS